ncbi:MAG: 4-(cytidine 5'-diphospho)-2-C-methyl-D-erythritol kinase [Pseudomonadota bacterium]|uniref:4-(cytidine 5'-diphospho)-2-C-methyl-D-erythritol kinase n=1 Tax=Thermithiobacillus tepidarius TaxID=929 RepID=UPI0003FFD322|nr:4-(cytidine 5'-diphospho)-2-C-methyl-D-erythritol kinase [Thermithiobacillus tepidarius]
MAEELVWYPAPAKLNLMLRVVGRRDDGYHLLQTAFQFLGHGDRLAYLSLPGRGPRRLSGLDGVAPADDLCVRAAQLLQDETGQREGVGIHLDKHLPLGGGLGGGSSDAATTLLVLNRLLDLGLSMDELAELGLRLGADVPVFVRGRAAWAEGVGEALQPLPDLPTPWYVVVHPGVAVSTREVFSAPELTRSHSLLTIRDFLEGAQENTLQPVVQARYPAVAQALSWLAAQGARDARLTGSGACVFGACGDAEAARTVAARVPAPWTAFAAPGVNRHPLHEQLGL